MPNFDQQNIPFHATMYDGRIGRNTTIAYSPLHRMHATESFPVAWHPVRAVNLPMSATPGNKLSPSGIIWKPYGGGEGESSAGQIRN
jgi:hypothetical protein